MASKRRPAAVAAAAVGVLTADAAWVGFAPDATGFRLAFVGTDAGTQISVAEGSARDAELLAVAVAYYEEALDAPPPEFEATQADLAGLVRWLAARATDPQRRSLLDEAVDAIVDGLAGDVIVARLTQASPMGTGETNEQADPVDLLVARYRALEAPGA